MNLRLHKVYYMYEIVKWSTRCAGFSLAFYHLTSTQNDQHRREMETVPYVCELSWYICYPCTWYTSDVTISIAMVSTGYCTIHIHRPCTQQWSQWMSVVLALFQTVTERHMLSVRLFRMFNLILLI